MTTGAEPQGGEQVTTQAAVPEQAEGKEPERKSSEIAREQVERSIARMEHTAERLGHALERPVIGASVAGGLIAAAAGLWGATEAALGAFVGVLAYRMLKRRRQRTARARASTEQPAVAG